MTAATTPPKGCPRDWRAWRRKAIESLLAPRFRLEDYAGPVIDPDQVMAQSWAIANVLDDCAPYGVAPAKVENLVTNLRSFTATSRGNLDVYHQFGHGGRNKDGAISDVDDFAYLDRVRPYVELPDLLKSADFLRKVSSKATYKEAKDLIDKHNSTLSAAEKWTVLIYQSSVLTTPDDAETFGRFFILVPGQKMDRWIQFGIWTPADVVGKSERINNVSVVSNWKTAGGNWATASVDWWRAYGDDGRIRINTRRQETGVTGNCFQCHKTSPIAIHTKRVYEFAGSDLVLVDPAISALQLKALNDRIWSYLDPERSTGEDDGFGRSNNYGPSIGPDPSSGRVIHRTKSFIDKCTAGFKLSAASKKNVQDQMYCSRCHQAGTLGLLNFPQATQLTTSRQLIDNKWPNLIHNYIADGRMPFVDDGPPALSSPDEREALFKCLVLEYYDPSNSRGLLVDWLKNEPSQASARSRPQSASAIRAASSSVR